MDGNSRDILSKLTSLADNMFGNGGGEVYLYGSRAKGNARPDSDWDILIIADDERSSADPFATFAFPYAELGWQYGVQITPLLYTRSQWDAEKSTAFYNDVTATRIRL